MVAANSGLRKFATHGREIDHKYLESSLRFVAAHLPFLGTACISSPHGHLPALLDILAHGQDEVFMQAHTYTSFAPDLELVWDGAPRAKLKNNPHAAIGKLARTQKLFRFNAAPPLWSA